MTEIILRWIAIVVLVVTAAIAALQWSSEYWPHVAGSVEAGNWQNALTLYGDRKGYEVRYTYLVDGRQYRGSRLGWASITNAVPVLNGADGKVESRTPRTGDKVNVYYASWYPGLSALIPGPSKQLWIWCVVSLLISLILIGVGRISTHPLY